MLPIVANSVAIARTEQAHEEGRERGLPRLVQFAARNIACLIQLRGGKRMRSRATLQ